MHSSVKDGNQQSFINDALDKMISNTNLQITEENDEIVIHSSKITIKFICSFTKTNGIKRSRG